MEVLTAIDTYLFLAVNHLPHSEFLDLIARGISGIGQWGLIWIIAAIIIFFREERRDHLFFIPFISVGILSAFSEFILKWIVARPRPIVEMGAIILDTPGNYSFPSSHAILSFAFSCILSHIESKITYMFYSVAILISISRIYLGVHFPSDIVFGSILGLLIGKYSLYLEHYWQIKTRNRKNV